MSYPEIAALLPHDAPMRLIDTLLAQLEAGMFGE